jgi:hypothetical protein
VAVDDAGSVQHVIAWRTGDGITHVMTMGKATPAPWQFLCGRMEYEDAYDGGRSLPGPWRDHVITCIACIGRLAYLAAL